MPLLTKRELKAANFSNKLALKKWVSFCHESQLASAQAGDIILRLQDHCKDVALVDARDLLAYQDCREVACCPDLSVKAEAAKLEYLKIINHQIRRLAGEDIEGINLDTVRANVEATETKINDISAVLNQTDRWCGSTAIIGTSLLSATISFAVLLSGSQKPSEAFFGVLLAMSILTNIAAFTNRCLSARAGYNFQARYEEIAHPVPVPVLQHFPPPSSAFRIGTDRDTKADRPEVKLDVSSATQPLLSDYSGKPASQENRP